MANSNQNVQTLTDFVRYGNTSTYSVPLTTFLRRVDEFLLLDSFTYEKYHKLLFGLSSFVELTDEELSIYRFKPDFISYRLYGTPNLWYLVLFMNNLERACNLNMNERIVLPPTSLSILSQIYSTEKEELDNKNNPISGEDLTLSTSRYANIPKYKIQKRYKAIVNNKDDSLNINKNVLSKLLSYNRITRNTSFNYMENINGFNLFRSL